MIIKKRFLAGLLCLLFSTHSWSSDFLMVIGAGGEEAKEDTIFDGAIKNIGDYVKRTPGVKVDVAMNGGHSKTVALINDSFPTAASKSDFLASDYQRLIQSYKLKLENNEMVAGDQLMIYVDSHGAEKEKNFKSHRIATSAGAATNLNTLQGASLVDLDQLEVLKKLAKDKGVKMAIIDASCHSGNSLALADDNTCVISGTGPNHYGYGTFSQNFSAAMKKGKSLEDIFLEARAMDNTPGLPMISTQSGQAVNSLIYDKITPYLYHFDDTNDKLMPYIQENNSAYQQCMADGNFNSLIATINSIEVINSVSKKVLWWTTKTKDIDLTNLKELLGKYKNSLDLVTTKMREIGSERLKKEETFDVSASVGNFATAWKQNYSWKDLITSDFNKLILTMQERINAETNNSNRTTLEAMKSLYTKAQTKKEELLRTEPDLATIPAKEVEVKKLIESNYFTNSAIATEERKLYSALYKNSQKTQSPTQPNPCQSFKL
ncbi:MAG: hypothetical protein H7281_08290 [Bacteriovorax sp.]|nr:hypothetical protein [Bacteriovorax sp.]